MLDGKSLQIWDTAFVNKNFEPMALQMSVQVPAMADLTDTAPPWYSPEAITGLKPYKRALRNHGSQLRLQNPPYICYFR